MEQNTQAQAPITLAVNEAGFLAATMAINKTVDKKYVKVGDVQYFVPTLAAFGIDAKVEAISEDDGLPVYADEKHDWLFSAICAKVALKVRSMLEPQSVTFKDGASAPADFAALMAEGKRGGAGQYMAMMSELRKAFAAYIDTLGKSAATKKVVCDAFANPEGVALASEDMRGKFAVYFNGFIEACNNAELLERGQKHLEKLLAACEAGMPDDF